METGFEFWKRVDSLLGDKSLISLAEGIGMNYATLKNQRSGNRYPKRDDVQKISDYLGTTTTYLMTGKVDADSLCDEALFVQKNTEARALVRAVMQDPSLLYPLSALIGRRASVEVMEKQA